MIRSRPLAALAASALLAFVAGCGGSDEPSGGGNDKPAASASGGTEVSIVDFKFMPPKITVPVGTKLVFSNDDKAAHTATANDRSFDTGSIRQRKRGSVTLKKAGTFPYICDFHPFMKGTVTVE